jgi:hypothetical protein
MPLKMKNAHCCRKRDHKGPPCVIESEIGKGRHMEVGTAIPPEKLREANRVPEVAGARRLTLWASPVQGHARAKKIRACHARDFTGCMQLNQSHAVISNMCQNL